MVRAKINKSISHDKEILLMTNHNFFVRDVITHCAKIAIASAIFAGLYIVSTVMFNYFMSTRTFSRNAESYTTAYIMWMILFAIFFLAYLCYEAHEIIKTYKEVAKIENDILDQ
jgi:hypothetical protein